MTQLKLPNITLSRKQLLVALIFGKATIVITVPDGEES